MSHDEDPPKKKPTKLRRISGRRTDKRPRTPADLLVRVTGPSGSMRDGKVHFVSKEPLISLWTVEFAVSVSDLLFGLERFRVHLEESMSREDDRFIDTNFEVGIETRVLPGDNPHMAGTIQIGAMFRRPRKPDNDPPGGKGKP